MTSDDLLKEINEFAAALNKASVWSQSDLSIAPVETRNDSRGVFYIYEFYCLLRIIRDLSTNYEMSFVPGEGDYEFKFPQAAADKKGKPKFLFKKDGKDYFEIFGGIFIEGIYKCEEDHPDISFFKPNSPDNADENWLIMIMDAKFVSDSGRLGKTEPTVFEGIVRRFKLSDAPRVLIKFDRLDGVEGNTLFTNGIFHADKTDGLDQRLKDNFIKEVQRFCPNETFEIAG